MAGADKNFDLKVILLKLEGTEGVDPGLTANADALRVLNYQPQFMDAEQKVRNLEKAYFGADPVAMAAFKRGASFDMEMAGSGTATGVPPWMKVLQIAGFAPGVVGASSVVQAPTSAVLSATHWGYIDDLLLKTLGARATASFRIEDDEFPMFSFTLLGVPPTLLAEQSVPGTPTLAGYIDPLLSTSQTTTFTLDGYACPLRSWEMSNNADLQFRSLIGPPDRVGYAGRAWSGTIVAQVPDLTAKNYFTAIRPGSYLPAQCVQGNTTGNIVQIDTSRLQVSGNVELSNEQGKLMMTLPVTALPNAGNDEVVFTTK